MALSRSINLEYNFMLCLTKDDGLRKRMCENAWRKPNMDISGDRIVGMTVEVCRLSPDSRN